MTPLNLLIFYSVLAVILVVVLARWIRRRRRERAAAAHALSPTTAAAGEPLATGAASETRTPAEVAVLAASPLPQTAYSDLNAPEFASTTLPGQMPHYDVQGSASGSPAIFDVLGKWKASSAVHLPRVEIAETPLAETSDYVFGALTPVLSALLPDSDERRTQAKKELRHAGFYSPHAHVNLAAIRYLCIMVPLVSLGLLLFLIPPKAENVVLGAMLIVPLVCWALPRLYVKGKARERTNQIEQGMPDMLDMLNMCVSQGMTVPAALKRVSQELPQVHPALYKELQIVSEQARIGTVEQALQNFSLRIDVPEVHSFTSLLIQTARMGTSVSTALAEYSDNIRAGLKQRADERGNRAAFRLLFPTVLCLMPAVYMFLLGPSILEMTKFIERDGARFTQPNQLNQITGPRRFGGGR